jgi:hypothetical protein
LFYFAKVFRLSRELLPRPEGERDGVRGFGPRGANIPALQMLAK